MWVWVGGGGGGWVGWLGCVGGVCVGGGGYYPGTRSCSLSCPIFKGVTFLRAISPGVYTQIYRKHSIWGTKQDFSPFLFLPFWLNFSSLVAEKWPKLVVHGPPTEQHLVCLNVLFVKFGTQKAAYPGESRRQAKAPC